jgi:hypothetical protein
MNSRVRALVWEELRVGGPIVGLILTIGVLLLVYISRSAAMYTHGTWPELAGFCLAVVLGAPLLCSLLLVLNIRNSGHLGGGLSRRILRMPVDTKATVTAPLLVRLAEVLVLTGVLALVCQLVFGQGPGGRAVMILASVYLVIQVLDWTRGVVNTALPVLAGMAALLLLHLILPIQDWFDVLGAQAPVTALSVLAFATVAGGAYALSLVLAGWSRCGERIEVLTLPAMPEFTITRRRADRQPFSSPWVARFWLELRQTGLFLPKMALICYVAGAGLRGLMDYFALDGAHWSRMAMEDSSLNGLWLCVTLPFAALATGTVAWRFRVYWTGRQKDRRASGWLTPSVLPDAQLAKARLAVAGLNLAVALGMVTALYAVYFLLHDNAGLGRLLAGAWTHGEINPREMGAIVLGVPLAVGLLAWFIMYIPMPVLTVYIMLPVLHFGVPWYLVQLRETVLNSDQATWDVIWDILGYLDKVLIAFTVIFPIVWLLGCLATLAWLGRVSWRSVLVCMAAWLLLALALFPFSARPEPLLARAAALCCLSLAALGAACWPQAVLALGGGMRRAMGRENAEQHRRFRAMGTGRHALLRLAAVAAVVAGVAWLRWPAEAAVVGLLRAEGLPTSLKELEQWYPPLPAEEENLAVKLMAAAQVRGSMNMDLNRTLGVQAQVARTERIPEKTWTITKTQWDAGWGTAAAMTHDALHSGLTQCRYPLWLQRYGGFTASENTVPALQAALQMELWVALVERRPEEAVTAILDAMALADTLVQEPLYNSQWRRLWHQYGTAWSAQTLLNRIEVPEEQLRRLQDGYMRARSLSLSDGFVEKTLAGERAAIYLANRGALWREDLAGRGHLYRPGLPMGDLLLGALALSATDVLGTASLSRVAGVSGRWRELEQSLKPEADGTRANWSPSSQGKKLINLLVPDFMDERRYYGQRSIAAAQDNGRLALDLAITAIAVDRFRMANGRLPERLEELVPAFLEAVPADPSNGGRPLSYRPGENGGFVVYRFGPNGADDNGEELKDNWRKRGDITFTVAPLDIRNRPQVADAAGAEGVGT